MSDWRINPVRAVHDELWAILERDASWTTLVAAGNRIKFNRDAHPDPIKDGVQDADLPEFAVEAAGKTINASDVHGDEIVQTYQCGIRTGSLSANQFDDVAWQTYRTLRNAIDTAYVGHLVMPHLPFVRALEVLSVGEQASTEVQPRGWVGLVTVNVTLYIRKQGLL